MSEIGSCLAFLCCCGSDDPSGSGGGRKAKPDPREKMIDDEFLARNYRQDSSGRFHTQPTPTNSMIPAHTASRPHLSDRDQSHHRSNAGTTDGGSGVAVEVEPNTLETGQKEAVTDHLQPPQLVVRDSESTAVDDIDLDKVEANSNPQIRVSAER